MDPSGPQAVVALVKVPARPKPGEYRGPVLINPGGPGGSGVDVVVSAGSLIQNLIGDEYDVIGFDPR